MGGKNLFETSEENGILHIRAVGIIRRDDAEMLEGVIGRYLAATKDGGRFLVDATALQIFAPDAADALLGIMKRGNPTLAKAAFVLTPRTTAALQLWRMIREAKNPRRRVFEEHAAALRWLTEPEPPAPSDV